jgi:hypothetical protein
MSYLFLFIRIFLFILKFAYKDTFIKESLTTIRKLEIKKYKDIMLLELIIVVNVPCMDWNNKNPLWIDRSESTKIMEWLLRTSFVFVMLCCVPIRGQHVYFNVTEEVWLSIKFTSQFVIDSAFYPHPSQSTADERQRRRDRLLFS